MSDPSTEEPRPRNIGAWIGVVVFFALIALLAAALLGGKGAKDPMIGRPAPMIDADLLAGNVPDGEAYVLNFWATWCTPCIVEHPILMEMADVGTPVIGVAYRDEESKIAQHLGRLGNPYSAIYFDPDGDSVADYGVRGVPETFVVNADGIITDRITGELKKPIKP